MKIFPCQITITAASFGYREERVSLRNDGEVTFPLNDHCPPSQSLINVEGTRPSVTLFQFATLLESSHQSTTKRQLLATTEVNWKAIKAFFKTLKY